MAQMVKNLPAIQKTWILSLGQEVVPWRRKWQPTPVFLPGEFYGQRSLVGYGLWGHKELDTTKGLTHTFALLTVCHTLFNYSLIAKY